MIFAWSQVHIVIRAIHKKQNLCYGGITLNKQQKQPVRAYCRATGRTPPAPVKVGRSAPMASCLAR